MKFKTHIGIIALCLVIVILVTTGCEIPTSELQTPPSEGKEQFSARAESEDGAIISWSGKTRYEPGAEAEFDLTIKNETDWDWHGRYCLQLLAGQSHKVVATLEQREFTLEPGVGFSETIRIRMPESLGPGAYGLSMAVRRPAGPMVDLVSIQVGGTNEVRRATTQQDMDASLAACPPVDGANEIVELAKADLAQRLNLRADQIEVQGLEPTEFPDASLGVPEPGQSYAQVITPGYVIELTVAGQAYRYHASEERIVAVPGEEDRPHDGSISIKSVTVSDTQINVLGKSTLPDGTCVSTELWADGQLLPWWPEDACAAVRQGAWELVFPLEGETLQTDVQYVLHAYGPDDPQVVATFPFDLQGPPNPSDE